MKQMLKHCGYTLIEILVVLLIISIVSSVALLSIHRNENKEIEIFANNIAQTIQLASEQAMLQPMILGLALDNRGFYFSRLQINPQGEEDWLLMKDSILSRQSVPSNIEVRMDIAGSRWFAAKDEKNPPIIISTNGDFTPFTIYIGKKGEKPKYAISGKANGQITNKILL